MTEHALRLIERTAKTAPAAPRIVQYGHDGLVSDDAIADALAAQHRTDRADCGNEAADPRLIDAYGPAECLRESLLPWKRIGSAVLVATARPDRFEAAHPRLTAIFGRVVMLIATEAEIEAAILTARGPALVTRAETRLPDIDSCRGIGAETSRLFLVAAVLAALAVGLAAPGVTLLALSLWALVTLLALTALKATAFVLQFRHIGQSDGPPPRQPSDPAVAHLPVVSILVPLYRERAIADRLVRRLSRLTYPRNRLEVCLVVEEDDGITRATLAAAKPPPWMRQIVVPRGRIKTKPRALNYAFEACRGSIVGVYDAEDAPAPDQIERVVQRFHQRGPDVACLQGVLDFYNARTNWLSRCFAVEYATWFRVVLPGFVRMGLVIPLGGTTLFFRRAALEDLGGWDAHNVTEDADLGVRLARRGYRTEMIESVTEEEANCLAWPWVKQRSRWLKGYALTWAVHMRDPRKLWQELGAWRFFGVQLLFLGTLSQFVLAPLLWSYWLVLLGLPHPAAALAPHGVLIVAASLFLFCELVSVATGILAVSGPRHRHLAAWVPSLHLYFPLAALACYKGLVEIALKPFYWDKTEHGHTPGPVAGPAP